MPAFNPTNEFARVDLDVTLYEPDAEVPGEVIYEGPASAAHLLLKPGVYEAVHHGYDDQLDPTDTYTLLVGNGYSYLRQGEPSDAVDVVAARLFAVEKRERDLLLQLRKLANALVAHEPPPPLAFESQRPSNRLKEIIATAEWAI